MIGHLNRGLASHAKLSLVDGMCGITFQFLGQSHFDKTELAVANDFRQSVDDANRHSATGGTEGTNARLPDGNTRLEDFLRYEPNQLVFRITATRKRCARSGSHSDFEKIPSIHESPK